MAKPSITSLKPYLAPLLLQGTADRGDALLGKLLAQTKQDLPKTSKTVTRAILGQPRAHTSGTTIIRVLEYTEETSPIWAPNSSYRDLNHHLLILAVQGSHAAICASDSAMRSRLAKKLQHVAMPVSRDTIERAFVGSRARAMWLNGIHPQTDAKPSAKTLMGPALEYSLDPLGDQSFYYSAVRSHVNLPRSSAANTQTLVGAAPDAGHIWVNRPGSWNDFVDDLIAILNTVASPPSHQVRFQALARTTTDLSVINGAYEIAIVPPELLSDDALPTATRDLAMRWAYDATFRITPQAGPPLTAQIELDGASIGTVDLQVTGSGDDVSISHTWTARPAAKKAEQKECDEILGNVRWLKIYYDSGHTIAQGRCYQSSYQDRAFTWKFESMSNFDVSKEKPDVPAGQSLANCIGTPGDDSLFAYVLTKMFPDGWLASDDGSMEFADFVHIDDVTNMVTLVHAKAASSQAANREVSASRYEVVVGQAVKNLRHLSNSTLAKVLDDGTHKKIAGAVWRNSVKQTDRSGLIARAEMLPANHPRQVIVLQPQLTKTEHDACRQNTASPTRIMKMHQLDTLMLGAELSAKAVGADFIGWAAA